MDTKAITSSFSPLFPLCPLWQRLLLIVLLLVLSGVSSQGAELTLDDCVRMAKEHNGRLKSVRMDIRTADEDVRIADAKRLPALKFEGQYSLIDRPVDFTVRANSFGPGIPPQEVDLSTGDRDFYALGLYIEQPLYTGGNLTHSLMKSRISREGTRHDVERQEKLLVYDVKAAFHNALKAKLVTEVLEKAIAAKQERLRVIKELHQEGHAQIVDILQMESDLSSAELDLFKAQNNAGLALSRLKRLIYYDGKDELVLKGSPVNAVLNASLAELTTAAIENRDDLKAALARVRAAGEDIEIARSGFYPKASLEGRYTRQEDTEIARPDVWTLTARLNWTLFDWNSTEAEVNKARLAKEKLRYENEELVKEIALQVEEAWTAVKESEKEVTVREQKVKTAEYKYSQGMKKYAEGVAKMADLLEMEYDLTRAFNEYLVAVNNLDIAIALLESLSSAKRQDWFTPEAMYRVGFDYIAAQLKEAIDAKKARDQNIVREKPADVTKKTTGKNGKR